MSLLCQVYGSSRKEQMYLYVEKARGLADVPADLMSRFGEPREVMILLLDPQRKLARVDTAAVLASIADKGFYLQLPPTPAELRRQEESRD